MSLLIALVATAVVVDGVRTIIQPGQPLPELAPHDERELVQSGAAENPADTAALAKADAHAADAAQREFQEARDRVTAAQASTAVDPEAATAKTAPKAKATK